MLSCVRAPKSSSTNAHLMCSKSRRSNKALPEGEAVGRAVKWKAETHHRSPAGDELGTALCDLKICLTAARFSRCRLYLPT